MAATMAGGSAAEIRRQDRWWLYPANVVVWLSVFGIYSLWTIVFFHSDQFHQYLSPFYSPQVAIGRTPVSPALFIFYIPLGFRATCYYYRKAYYRSFWLSPPACAVAEPRKNYSGETRFPLILQNIHRYFFYFALIFAVILSWDALTAFRFPHRVGVSVGTLILLVNAVLIWLYTLSCHSCRHLCGGNLNTFSRSPVRHWLWQRLSVLNHRHMLFAWLSLFWVAWSDFYIWLVASGAFHDPRIIG